MTIIVHRYPSLGIKVTVRRFHHRTVEPHDRICWTSGLIVCHLVQEEPRGLWFIRCSSPYGGWFSEPMTLREALVRVKLGVVT